jgi:hypothetical protein
MRRYLGLGVAWLGATVLSVLIASTAVAGIRDRVVEAPVAAGPPTTTTTVAPVTTTSTTQATTTSTSNTTTTATTTPPETTTTIESQTTTTAPPDATTTTTTTATTTTTVASPEVKYETYTLIGGTVTLEIGEGTVHVASASPNLGFARHVEKDGPTEVKVEFEGNQHKSTLTAYFESGEIKAIPKESGEGGDDGGEHDD